MRLNIISTHADHCSSVPRSIASLIINTAQTGNKWTVDSGPGSSVNNCINTGSCMCRFCAISGHWVTMITKEDWVELLLIILCIYLLSDTDSALPAV